MGHWRSGWRFWPAPREHPVGAAYRQVRWVRPYRPGFPRVAAVAVLALVVSQLAVLAVLLLVTPGAPLAGRLLLGGVALSATVGMGMLLGRTFASGIYVNDAGLRLVTVRRTLTADWAEVVDVSDVAGRQGLLGVPLVPVPGRAVVVTVRDLGPVRTPLTSVGPDFLGRAEAYAMAAGAVERWWRDAGNHPRPPRSTPTP